MHAMSVMHLLILFTLNSFLHSTMNLMAKSGVDLTAKKYAV